MRILIATGIYPPEIGGPAQYAKNLAETWRSEGHEVSVAHFNFEKKLPTGLRHIFYFFRILPAMMRADFCLILDTWSAALPAIIAAKIFGTKTIIRTGGDFLWESYVERTGEMVLFRDFYLKTRVKWNAKERFIFKTTRSILRNASVVVFSTQWQMNIWTPAYDLASVKTHIIENFYGERELLLQSKEKNFVTATRALKWKNMARLRQAFATAQEKYPDIVFDTEGGTYESFFEKIRRAYALILVSIGDISPNMILDSIRAGVPFICTKETGLYEKLKDVGLFVDPENEAEIVKAIETMAEPYQHAIYKKKVELFSFTHTWPEISREFISLFKTL